LLLRNRIAAVMTLFMPIVFAVLLILNPRFGSAGSVIVATIVAPVAGLGTYLTATSTLAARRSEHILKRLRLTALSPLAIITGTLLPIMAINLIQLTIIIATALVVTHESPASWLFLTVSVLAVELTALSMALLTSLWTNSAEHAQYTTLPLLITLVGVAFWVIGTYPTLAMHARQPPTGMALFTTDGQWALWLQMLLPGGAPTQLLFTAFGSSVTPACLVGQTFGTLFWIILPAWIGLRFFAWEPRGSNKGRSLQSLKAIPSTPKLEEPPKPGDR
jgi:ABC-2 type transport system permease protein